MSPKLVTFDCANTLIWTDWQVETFAVRCAEIAGLEVPSDAGDVYLRLFSSKLAVFAQVNRLRSLVAWREFWVQQVSDWLDALGIVGKDPRSLHMVGEREIFETPSRTFRAFEDALPAVRSIRTAGIKVAVLSNWDHSLHGCLAAHGFSGEFDAVFASLEYGVEKPDPRFFQVALEHFDLTASEVFHVGDDYVDDYEGANGVGIPTVLLERGFEKCGALSVNSLEQLEEAFTWFA